MQYVRTDWTIVLVGSWNAGIFQPAWLATHVFGDQPIQLEVQIGMPPALRFHCGDINLIVAPDRLIGAVKEETPAAWAQLVETLCKILDLLPHTPINALGINFGFQEPAPDRDLLRNFEAADNTALVNFGAVVRQTTIQRELQIDGEVLRLKEAQEGGGVTFHLNFHTEVGGGDKAAAVAAAVIRKSAAQKMDRALELLRVVYGLTPEPTDAV